MRINFLKYIGIVLVFCSIFNSCNKSYENTTNLSLHIPANAGLIIKTVKPGEFFHKIDSTAFFKENAFLINPALKEQLLTLSKFSGKEEIFLAFSKDGEESDFTFIAKELSQPFTIDSVKNKSVETFTYEDFSIKKYTLEGITFFSSLSNGIFFASNSKDQLEYALAPKNYLQSQEFEKALAAADPDKTSLFINHSILDSFLTTTFPETVLPLGNLASWSVLDVDFEGSQIIFNGISTSGSKPGNTLSAFKNLAPGNNKIAQITPATATGFYSFTYNSFKTLHDNLNEIRNDSLTLSPNHLLNFTNEAGIIFYEEQNFLVLKTPDPELAGEAIISPTAPVANYRGIDIFEHPENLEISSYLIPLVQPGDFRFYTQMKGFIIFSETQKSFETIIASILNTSPLGEQEYYLNAMTRLAESSSLLFVANTDKFQEILNNSGSGEFSSEIEKLNLKNYPVLALQFVSESDFAHIHGIFSTAEKQSQNGTQLLSTLELKRNPGTPPFLVKNHQTGNIEVVVQDQANVLYLYSQEGKQQWKKPLESRITGSVHQVDIFKNGNLQLAFSTQNNLYILDRNGNNETPFPLKFKDPITQPLAVFDYDNNRNYRFLITQNQDILMYDSKGKIVKGFDFEGTASAITSIPKHIRTGNKDYIVVPESNGKLNVLSRQGKSRISVKEKIDFSKNQWFLNNGNFVSVNSSGELVTINENGAVSKETISAEGTPVLSATNEVLVILSENILKINNTTVTLDYGLYTAPKLFEIGKKTYVSITDTQAQRVFIFDENGKLFPGFPVYGTSPIDMKKENKEILFTVSGEEKSVLIYKL